MRAVVLAAGKGNRLRPLTDDRPKPLLALGSRSILEQTLALLSSAGIAHVAINLHYHGETIRQALGNGSAYGLAVSYSPEPELLGTAGGTRRAAGLLPGTWPLLVVYGDNLVQLNLSRMYAYHRAKGAVATIALHAVSDVRGSGVVQFDPSGRISTFVEKPQVSPNEPGWVNAGVYLLEKGALDAIPFDAFTDFGHDTFPKLLADGQALFAYCLFGAEAVYPIDTPDRYRRAVTLLAEQERRNEVTQITDWPDEADGERRYSK